MSTPTKRRRKNDYQPSSQPVKGLDFFFNKPKTSVTPLSNDVFPVTESVPNGNTSSVTEATPKRASSPGASFGNRASSPEETELSDEQLARKLQEQWAQEDGIANVTKPDEAASPQTPSHGGASQALPQRQSNGLHQPEPVKDASKKASTSSFEPKKLALSSASNTEDATTVSIPFDEDPLTFEPSKYLPSLKAQWEQTGGRASYGLLTRAFVLVNSTTSRIKTVDTLCNFLRVLIEGDPGSLLPAVWLTTNAISPPYISLELGLGGSAISKALKKVCGLDNAALKTLYDKHGDAGDVAFEAKRKQSFTLQQPKPLSVRGVFQALTQIANSKGHGSQEAKQRLVERLLQDAQSAEQSRYLVRTLCQHLRIGAVKTTMLIALSRAFLRARPPEASFPIQSAEQLRPLAKDERAAVYAKGEELVKACFARRPNYNDLVPGLLALGLTSEMLVRCGLALHIPLRPMLGNITRDLGEMLTKLQGRSFTAEWKYDGQRAQVHCDDSGRVSIFSRHLEVMTDKYPDLVALVPKVRGDGVSSFILEGEVVAVDRSNGELKPFQTLTNRARKDVDIGAVTIDVCLFAFDLMYLNGESLLDRDFRERRELLRSLFVEVEYQFTWVRSLDATSGDAETVSDFFKSATNAKCEGIMVKVLDSVAADTLPESEIEAIHDAEHPLSHPPKHPPTPKKKKAKNTKRSVATKEGGAAATKVEREDDKESGARRKALLATYEPDKRSDSWLKVKKDYHTAADTLDLIPVAGWHGQGRKAKWWSPVLLAVRNPETGCLEAVTKCISGFTDKFYQAIKEKYAADGPNVVAAGPGGTAPSYIEYDAGRPDVWFAAQEVWEMAFADITISPTYLAARGLVSAERGLSTRFPRFLRVRDDKSIDEASTAEDLANLWRKQEAKAPSSTERGQGAGLPAAKDDILDDAMEEE